MYCSILADIESKIASFSLLNSTTIVVGLILSIYATAFDRCATFFYSCRTEAQFLHECNHNTQIDNNRRGSPDNAIFWTVVAETYYVVKLFTITTTIMLNNAKQKRKLEKVKKLQQHSTVFLYLKITRNFYSALLLNIARAKQTKLVPTFFTFAHTRFSTLKTYVFEHMNEYTLTSTHTTYIKTNGWIEQMLYV